MNLKRHAARGAAWTGGATIFTTALHVLQWVVLARVLAPEDFGLMAMCLVVLGLADAFADLGMSAAIIHRQEATRLQLSSLYWLNIAAGIVVFVIVATMSPLAARLFGDPRLTALIAWAALRFLVLAPGQQFRVLLQKNLHFRTLARIDVLTAGVATIVAIVTALSGQGVWALIWGYLAGGLLRSLLLMTTGWKLWHPHLHFRSGDLEGFMSFGAYQMGERLVNYFAANVDYMVIGRVLGPNALGFYTLAYQLVIMPLSKINPVLMRVAFPLLASRQHDESALRRGYLELIRLLGFAIGPVVIGLAVTAPLLVPALFGEQWTPSIALLQILCGVGLLKALSNPAGSLLLARGRADVGFFWNLVVAAANTAAFLLASMMGMQAVAWAYLAMVAIQFVIFHAAVLPAVVAVPGRQFAITLQRPAVLSVVMGAVVGIALLAMRPLAWPDALVLSSLIGLGMVTFVLLLVVCEQAYLADLWRLIARQPREI